MDLPCWRVRIELYITAQPGRDILILNLSMLHVRIHPMGIARPSRVRGNQTEGGKITKLLGQPTALKIGVRCRRPLKSVYVREHLSQHQRAIEVSSNRGFER